uniref:Cyclin N-terminal domain-containing protein n=1 Tax=Trichuris muris TaxID=70415 RepID=A0A5S6QCY1_TRIMR
MYGPNAAEDLEEHLAILGKENLNRIRAANERKISGYFFDRRCVEFIFMACDHFHFTPDVRFATVCLFDAFMTLHVNSLWRYVDENCRTEEAFLKDWSAVETKLSGQVVLRVVSCIQIASKLSAYGTQLTVASAKDFLQHMGFCYTEEQILKTELRVLKTLNYDVSIRSPLAYVSTLLRLIANDVQQFGFQSISTTCQDVLSFVFMQWDEIFESILPGPIADQEKKQKIATLKADYMLLAGGVVASAIELSPDLCNEPSALLSLSKRCSIPVEKLKDFRANVKNSVFKAKKSNMQPIEQRSSVTKK